jgi:hypothetical protein
MGSRTPCDCTALYEQLYCDRGEAENRIKEAQLDLFGRRASCHKFQGNQLRLLLAGLAYTLMINLRRLALRGTELEHACTATIRVKLLKIGAALVRNTSCARAAGIATSAQAGLPRRRPRAGPIVLLQCCPRHAKKLTGVGGIASCVDSSHTNRLSDSTNHAENQLGNCLAI